ncbi:uncharacterized protein LOC123441440 [Hordeum vulgare subsp. vulgare]|uniref:uncharacterized protein LOC123441440 n=1 Tax=Hordeum vulgare subsp. vulgare TaxID=112509 RepID=UPI001D1A3CDE|nr:uncharacterized protein LOC123441440 [Hordeum vulgare subsp. vulgare]
MGWRRGPPVVARAARRSAGSGKIGRGIDAKEALVRGVELGRLRGSAVARACLSIKIRPKPEPVVLTRLLPAAEQQRLLSATPTPAAALQVEAGQEASRLSSRRTAEEEGSIRRRHGNWSGERQTDEGGRKRVRRRSDVEAADGADAGDVPVPDAGGHRQGRQPILLPRRGGRQRHEGEAVGGVQGRPGPDHSSRLRLLSVVRPVIISSSPIWLVPKNVFAVEWICWLNGQRKKAPTPEELAELEARRERVKQNVEPWIRSPRSIGMTSRRRCSSPAATMVRPSCPRQRVPRHRHNPCEEGQRPCRFAACKGQRGGVDALGWCGSDGAARGAIGLDWREIFGFVMGNSRSMKVAYMVVGTGSTGKQSATMTRTPRSKGAPPQSSCAVERMPMFVYISLSLPPAAA